MTVARKLAILPVVSLVGILLISVVLMRDIRSVYRSASYGNDFAVPNLLILEQLDSNFVGVRLTMRIVEEGKQGLFKVLAGGMNDLTVSVAGVIRAMSVAATEVRMGAERRPAAGHDQVWQEF